jgi:DNA-binding CsgD family transcriptional regulator
MTDHSSFRMLRGRSVECQALDELIAGARGRRSGVLVLHGEAGIGKTALLDHAVSRSAGCRVARISGTESETELPLAALHQLCTPFLGLLDGLPAPQRDAVQTAFGIRSSTVPDRFLVGLAVLTLLSKVAEEKPLICVIDDAQWLDRATIQTLTFVARRLLTEPIAVVFAQRESGDQQALSGLPRLAVEGLTEPDARQLLQTVVAGPLDPRVRDRIVAETRGNPLALLELAHGLTAAQLAFGPDADGMPPVSRIEQEFVRRVQPLPIPTQRLLLLAAAEPVGDPTVLWRAADRLGIRPEAARPATVAGLLDLGARVRFRHPLVRSAVYRGASDAERRSVHQALAEATDATVDPDRRAWHRANSAIGTDDDVAGELEASAERAQARGGAAAAASFLERACSLTVEAAPRARRALAAARAHHRAGAFEASLALLSQATAGPLTALERAEGDRLRAQITFATTFGADAPMMLLEAARRLEPLDVRTARDTYLEALAAVRFAADGDGALVSEVARAALAAPPAAEPVGATDVLVDGLAVRYTDGLAAAKTTLQAAVAAFSSADLPPGTGLQWLWLAGMTALDLWDDEAWFDLADRHVALVRGLGVSPLLPIALSTRSAVHVCAGELREAAILNDEVRRITERLGGQMGPYASLVLAATWGREDESVELIDVAIGQSRAHGQGLAMVVANYAGALLYNGLGRYEQALTAAERATVLSEDLGGNTWALAELVEAAHHSRHPERGAEALRRLSAVTEAAGTDWGLGVRAAMAALLTEGEGAEPLYRESLDRLRRTRIRLALARADLLYGEWLRRRGRRLEARQHLRSAYHLLSTMGVEAFAERARRELVATGETARKRVVEDREDLTVQEEQIARLALAGRTNLEIGAELFLSGRTVEWHLRKIFIKLNIGSRRQLREVLPPAGATRVPARTGPGVLDVDVLR